MSEKIRQFKEAKQGIVRAKEWALKIGQVYYGGTSGRGALGRITDAKVGMTVYHQHSDGDTNYHDAPEALRKAIASVLVTRSSEIIGEAIAKMEITASEMAALAAAEHESLMQEAGLLARQDTHYP